MKKNTALEFFQKFLQQTSMVLMSAKQEKQLITGKMMNNGGKMQRKMACM